MSIRIDTRGFLKQLTAFSKDLNKKISDNLLDIMRERLAPRLIDRLMTLYDERIASAGTGTGGVKDPANPASTAAYSAFNGSLVKDVNDTLRMAADGEISLSLGNLDTLGYKKHTLEYLKKGVPKNPSPLDWMIFYLEGFIGDFYFITYEDYVKMRPLVSEEKFKEWGWYGEGFLIPAAKVEGSDRGLFKKHPFSGIKPSKIFDDVMQGVDFDAYVDEAIEKAIKDI